MHVRVALARRIRNCLTQLNAKDITDDEKKELDEDLHRAVRAFDTREYENFL
jgi:hypothetical protein